jgi:hypothetical protein
MTFTMWQQKIGWEIDPTPNKPVALKPRFLFKLNILQQQFESQSKLSVRNSYAAEEQQTCSDIGKYGNGDISCIQ